MTKLVGVAISVYKSDRKEFLQKSLDSILSQRKVNVVIYLQVDGFVESGVEKLLNEYETLPNLNVMWHKENLGLATRLNQSIELALKDNVDFIARMDADDISISTRFMTQIEYFNSNPDVDVVGSEVIEITETGKELYYKSMSDLHEDLASNIIKKCPFNHPTVMFKAALFKEGFRYKEHLMNTQDYYLWVDLLASGKRFSNVKQALLYFRVDEDFHSRRGLKKAINDCKSRFYAFRTLGNMSLSNLFHVVKLFSLRVSPKSIKVFVYRFYRS
ncbi:Gt3 [Vibrio chagasii]|nr:Gt3 [Vibrio chagasii]CAH7167134.1 Gt3 [Vibrio chagasii]CAH7358361.1 Gt3 [Vibrio chagasii]